MRCAVLSCCIVPVCNERKERMGGLAGQSKGWAQMRNFAVNFKDNIKNKAVGLVWASRAA